MCVAEQMNSGLRPRANFGRPVVAVSAHTHMSVAERVKSGLHPTFKGYKGFADQLLL